MKYPEGWVEPTEAEKTTNEIKLPHFPTNDSIMELLDKYALEINTLKDSYINEEIDISEYYEDKNNYEKLYAQAFKLLFTKEDISYGDIFLKDDFIRATQAGFFIPYDGEGYYADFNGNELGDINWDNPNDYPKATVYVVWYNK